MALQTYTSIQKTAGYRLRPYEDHGKMRIEYFEVPAANVTVLGDDGSLALLCSLPPGAVRVLPHASRVISSAFGASRKLDIGHAAYQSRDQAIETFEPVNYQAFAANIDNSSAITTPTALSTTLKYDLYSKKGVDVYARCTGGTWPIGGTISGYLLYIYE